MAGIIATMDQDSSPTTNRPLHRRGLERLDLMLLSLEALDYNETKGSIVDYCRNLRPSALIMLQHYNYSAAITVLLLA